MNRSTSVRAQARRLGCVAVLLAACGDSPTLREPDLVLNTAGRAERGLVLELAATAGGAAVPPGEIRWTVEPAEAAGLVGPSRLQLREAGTLTLRAAYGGRTAQIQVTVSMPPSIVFDWRALGAAADVYRAALDGRDMVRLTQNVWDDWDPTVAGGSLVFLSTRDGNYELYSVPLAGGVERRLTQTSANEITPALSPDGTRLLFGRGTPPNLFLARTDATSPQPLAPSLGDAGVKIEASGAWSPTGDRVAFVSTAGGTADVYLWSPADTLTRVVAGAAYDGDPAWSPDGSRIVFVTARDGNLELYTLTLTSGQLTRLTNSPGVDYFPTWLPDGRIVYVGSIGDTRRLFWLDPDRPAETHEIPLPAGEARNPAALP
jgi:dipeptidyl aminopeptidase/acylaminoacyl peptidase